RLGCLNIKRNLFVVCTQNRCGQVYRSIRDGNSRLFRNCTDRLNGRIDWRRQRCFRHGGDLIAGWWGRDMEQRGQKPRNEEEQDEYFEESRDYSIHRYALSSDPHNDLIISRIDGERAYVAPVVGQ